MSKACKAWQNIQFLKWCREAGVYVGWYIMCDFPGEDDAWYGEMADLLPLLTHLQPPWALARVRLDRFSHYHEHASEAGMSLYPPELYRSIYPVGDKALRDLVYFFEDDARRRNPMLAYVLERPGIRATSRAAARWKLTFWSGNRAGLSMDVTDCVIKVQDTRPIAVRRTFSLEGLDRDLYLACDAATTERDLMDRLRRDGVTGEDIKAALRRLTRYKLMIETGARYLALAVRAPVPDLPGSGEYPGGAVMARPEPLSGTGLEDGASTP
jgi:magnesium-protoporphyrin IX monomethyl ester (oxidative) cyclase